MKKIMVHFLVILMIWTVIGRDFQGNSFSSKASMIYILQNEQGERKVIKDSDYRKNPLIVGDKIKIIKTHPWSGKPTILERVEDKGKLVGSGEGFLIYEKDIK